jgi:hypothetical protein
MHKLRSCLSIWCFWGAKEDCIFIKRYLRRTDRCTIFKFTLKFPRENESLNFALPECGWGCNKNNLDTPIDSFNWEVIKSGIKSDWKTFFAIFFLFGIRFTGYLLFIP